MTSECCDRLKKQQQSKSTKNPSSRSHYDGATPVFMFIHFHWSHKAHSQSSLGLSFSKVALVPRRTCIGNLMTWVTSCLAGHWEAVFQTNPPLNTIHHKFIMTLYKRVFNSACGRVLPTCSLCQGLINVPGWWCEVVLCGTMSNIKVTVIPPPQCFPLLGKPRGATHSSGGCVSGDSVPLALSNYDLTL